MGLVLVAVYAALRTVSAPNELIVAWTAVAVAGTVISPALGLTVLAAIGPFTGALEDDGRISAVPFLLAGLGAGLVVSLALLRPLPRLRWPLSLPAWPLVFAIVVMVGTALGVLHSWLAFGPDLGRQAAELWVPGIGGAMTVFVAAAWVAWRGEIRPLCAAVASVTVAAVLSLVDFYTVGAVNASPLGWLLHDQLDTTRLSGIILAPNAAAAIFLVGVSMTAAAALMLKSSTLRVLAVVGAAACGVAVVLTLSRSALISLALVAVVLVWRWKGWKGLVVGGVIALLAVGGYALFINGELLRSVPDVADQDRQDAWGAAFRMWLDQPITGAGFRSFEWLYEQYGSVLDAPHNELLRLFAEEGMIVGIAGALFAIVTPLVLAFRARGYIAAGAAAAAVAVFLMAGFNNPLLYTQVNVPAFLVLGAGLALAFDRTSSTILARC